MSNQRISRRTLPLKAKDCCDRGRSDSAFFVMPFSLFGTPPRPTACDEIADAAISPTRKILNSQREEVDSHIDTALQMQEIRKALLEQQSIDNQSKTDDISSSLLNESRAMTESSSSVPTTPSPRRRYNYDDKISGIDTYVPQSYNYWDAFEAEKKDDGEHVIDTGEPQSLTDTNVILYNDGATELFKCIEEGMWVRGTEILHSHPEQASIWILSTGTMNTTFNWSKWKRLPLHEAARRQPPADFMTLLIATFPDAVKAVTQFGELPLHLAVECGASPTVVNLLAVSNWRGCHETDQSGRTPLDVLQENDSLLDPIEHKAVVDALSASALAYEQIVNEHSDEIQQLRDEHEIGLAAVRQQHDDDLLEEQDKQDKLLQQVAALQQQLSTANSVIARQQVEIHSYKSNEQLWKDNVSELEKERNKWMELYRTEHGTVQELRLDVFNRDQQALALSDQIVDLQTCIQRLANWHKTTVRKQIHKLKKSYDNAHSELLCFTNTLNDHNDDLQALLVDIGIDELPIKKAKSRRPTNTDDGNGEMIDGVPPSDPSVKANDYEEDAFDVVEDDDALVSRVTQTATRNVCSPK